MIRFYKQYLQSVGTPDLTPRSNVSYDSYKQLNGQEAHKSLAHGQFTYSKYNNYLTQFMTGYNKVSDTLWSCESLEQFGCIGDMVQNLCNLSTKWLKDLRRDIRKDPLHWITRATISNKFRRIALEHLDDLCKQASEWSQKARNIEPDTIRVVGFQEE